MNTSAVSPSGQLHTHAGTPILACKQVFFDEFLRSNARVPLSPTTAIRDRDADLGAARGAVLGTGFVVLGTGAVVGAARIVGIFLASTEHNKMSAIF